MIVFLNDGRIPEFILMRLNFKQFELAFKTHLVKPPEHLTEVKLPTVTNAQLYCNQKKTDVKKEHTTQISGLQLLQRILDIYARTFGISDSVHFITSAAI